VDVADAVIGVVAIARTLGIRAGAGFIPMTSIVLVAGAVGGIAFAWLAVNRFWWMLLALFALRPTLDGLSPNRSAGGGLEPSTVVGGMFLLAGILWLVVQYRSGAWTKLSRSSLAFLIFGGVAVVSSIGAPLPISSLESASKLLSIAVMLAVLEQIFAVHPERIKPLLIATFASFVVPALVGYVQLRGSKPAQTYNAVDVGRIEGTFVHPSAFASYLVLIIVLAVALAPYVTGRWRRSLGVIAVAALPLLLFTYARGAWVALYVTLLVVGLAQSKWLVIGLLAGALVVVFTVPSVSARVGDLSKTKSTTVGVSDPNSLSWRIRYWGRVLPLVKQNPITGIGFDMVAHTTPEKLPPHNGFVQAFVETGVLGLASFLAIVAAIWADLRTAARRRLSGFGRGMTLATAAISLALFMQLFSENLLGQSVILWYFLGPLAWVIAAPVSAVPRRRSLTPAAV
jgi:putative inorganic carbon (hco3(-)) transporter